MNRKLNSCDILGAFTLVETLVVMAIVGVIAVIGLPALSSLQGSYNLTSAGQAVLGQFTYARQDALTNNRAIQIRIYQTPDANGILAYRAMQCFREGTDASGNSVTVPLLKPFRLPDGFAFVYGSGNTSASTLLNPTVSGAGSSTGDSAHPLPGINGGSPYIYFRFRPNGRTDLTATSLLTLASQNAPIVANNLPANFVTLQIDAVNGNVRIYRP